MTLNIGIVIGRFPPDLLGGAELQARQVAEQLAQRGHQVLVFTRRYQGRPYLEIVDGYTICRRNELPWPGLRMAWDTFPAVRDIARHRPEVLLCYQTLNSGLIGLVSQFLLGIPLVLSVRGNREYRIEGSLTQRLLVPPIFEQARRVVVQSERLETDMYRQFHRAGKAKLVDTLRKKTVVIPNGIQPLTTEGEGGHKIIFVGRLIKNKGVADLIQGMHQLPEAELLVVGDGPDRARLEALARELPVSFVGQVAPPAVSDYLQQARVLVLPSHLGDGFPNVILEAMAHGVPVVATATAGIPDLVRPGETGYLFDIGDINQMVSAIRRTLADDQAWQRLRAGSLAAVSAYAWDAVIPQIEQLLYDVTEQKTEGLKQVT